MCPSTSRSATATAMGKRGGRSRSGMSTSSCNCKSTKKRIYYKITKAHHYLLVSFIMGTLYNHDKKIVSAEDDPDNFFCGKTWADASENCDDRQPCPNAMDDECSTPDHVCFGGTLCSAEAGHGSKFKYQKLKDLLDIDYDETSNTMFCGTWWGGSEENCSIQTFCGDTNFCFNPMENCFATPCNIIDKAEEELGSKWKELVGGGNYKPPAKMDPYDPKRNFYCGVDWTQASAECGTWCNGNEGACPSGQKCFADTTCYYDVGVVPSLSPIVSPRPTASPLPRDDPANFSFCGNQWGIAIQKCSPKTHCFSDDDCKKNEVCYPDLPGCNLSEMTGAASSVTLPKPEVSPETLASEPWLADPNLAANYRFCGTDWTDAADHCTLDRHCPNYKCPHGLSCFENLDLIGANHCNAYKITIGDTRMPTGRPTTLRPTEKPSEPPTPSPSKRPTPSPTTAEPTPQLTPGPTTAKPTAVPTAKPTTAEPTPAPTKYSTHRPTSNAPVPVVHGLCAENFQHLKDTYDTARKCSNINPCAPGQFCFPIPELATSYESVATYSPTGRVPTYSPSGEIPTYSPTDTTKQQTNNMGKDTVQGKHPTHQTNAQKPTGQAVIQPPTSQPNTPNPTMPREITPKPTSNSVATQKLENEFYCARSVEELEKSCGSASKCGHSAPCPPGLGCILYNDCKQPQQQNESETIEEEHNSSLPNYFPHLCPLELVGMHAVAGDCRQYYDCKKGLLEASHTCDLGFLFDNSRGECISQKFINSKCTSEDMAEVPDLCPEGLIGLHSPPAKKDCSKYYDCYDGLLWATKMCALGLKFSNDLGKCVPGKLVGSNCNGGVLEVNNDQYQITNESGEMLPENYSPDICPAGYTGLHSHGACEQYYECNNVILMAVHACDLGLKFDIDIGKCVSEELVGKDCKSVNAPKSQNEEENNNLPQGNDENQQIESDQEAEAPKGIYEPDFCPLGYIGQHAKEDCSKYYDCNNGYMGSVNTCTSNLKFDKVRGRCFAGELVNVNCYGPPLDESEREQMNQKLESDEDQNAISSESSTVSSPPAASPSNVGGGSFTWSYTATPTATPPVKDGPGFWIREYDDGGRMLGQAYFLWMSTLVPIIWQLYRL